MPSTAPGRPLVLTGRAAAPGAAVGPAVRLPAARDGGPAGAGAPAADAATEVLRFGAAAAEAARLLSARAAQAPGEAGPLLRATAALAVDPALHDAVAARIGAGEPAPAATRSAVQELVERFAAAGGPAAERVAELLDVRDRILAGLAGRRDDGPVQPDHPSVLLADDLAPSEAVLLDPARVLALALAGGTPTGHTALIARELGLPCVVGLGVGELDAVPTGSTVLVDGGQGTVTVDPDVDDAHARVSAARPGAGGGWAGPGRTRDGRTVPLLANVQDAAGARAAVAAHAEGVGLYRTELAFLGRGEEPSVEEQAAAYAEVLEVMAGRTVVLRTLDAGADKPLRFSDLREEANPALGVRGLRAARRDAGVLERQLDAIAAAGRRTGATPWVMAPMVATVPEAAAFATAARDRGLVPGAMVEVPSAALHAERLLAHVDFLSVGTNDLAQYALAADRLSADLADLTDPWQPALLELVALTAAAGARVGKPVGVCGEAAADPLLACVLVGLGVTSLSCAPSAVAAVGARLGRTDLADCRRAAQGALAADDPDGARAAAAAVLDGTGEQTHPEE
ncbi:putative PEP-binding protein [Blastococcus sp. TF02A-30]|uniref:putative PEP-binding protein n=1 Tax=Blastococcus sp. TF02A-30 TaxID=2250580 RepID=UPI000DEAEEB3|nr:putative PEP-binding protein [Blastococcus sp. TF02A-30]RBY92859.1 phosphoenolpyruvate--protein phosphotransferase [Blastococcus sp. TF02A-30]